MISLLLVVGCTSAPTSGPSPTTPSVPSTDTGTAPPICSAVVTEDGRVQDCWVPDLWDSPRDFDAVLACCACDDQFCNPQDNCPDGVRQHTVERCAETTSTDPGVVSGTQPVLTDWVVEAQLVEAGAGLAAVAGSEPVGGHDACDGTFDVLRFVDGAGDTWSVGWKVDSGLAAPALDVVTVGETYTVSVRQSDGAWCSPYGFLVEDAAGPVWIGDQWRVFGSWGVEEQHAEQCWLARREVHQVTFASDTASVAAWPGEVVRLPVSPDIDALLVAAGDDGVTECGGEFEYWLGWRGQ